MPLYSYTVLDEQGRRHQGQLEASSESALEGLLRKQGQWLTEARERTPAIASRPQARGNRAVSRRVLIEFFLQTALQLRSGVSLVDALAFGLRDIEHLPFGSVQPQLLEQVRSGSSFSEALAAHPRTFPVFVVNLVRAGEASGRLSEVCMDIRRYFEWLDRLTSDMRQALLYPSIVLAAAAAFFVLVFTFLIPRFSQVLTEIKVKMPMITVVYLEISKFMVGHWGVLLAVTVAAAVTVTVGPKVFPAWARLLDRFRLWVPILGQVHHLICLSRVAQNLATLYRAGIPLLSALQLCRPLAGNILLEEAVARVETGVNEGRPMNETMLEDPLFSRLMVQMVAVGESTGTLGDSLQHVSEYYNEIVPRQVKKLLGLLEPILILGLIVMVGSVALAVFLPIAAMFDAR